MFVLMFSSFAVEVATAQPRDPDGSGYEDLLPSSVICPFFGVDRLRSSGETRSLRLQGRKVNLSHFCVLKME